MMIFGSQRIESFAGATVSLANMLAATAMPLAVLSGLKVRAKSALIGPL